jgi:nifR3 family TIM-barrel protein
MTGAAPVRLGPLELSTPVILAPMAGVTNYPFRALCQRFGAGLYVGEMVNARPLVESRNATIKLTSFGPGEAPRSLQLMGNEPSWVGEAVALLVGEERVDHLDLNFGCPVRKITRHGGGAAVPARPRLLAAIIRAAVRAAGSVPITIKTRLGIDEEHLSYLEAGRVAAAEGCAAITLHARTASQLYDGQARWEAIAELKASLPTLPVFGNGDIWQADDALRMLAETGCDGVCIGRGCLGRPWLFRDLAAALAGREPEPPPSFGEVVDTMVEHATMLAEWLGERSAMLSFRKQAGWYTRGFRASSELRERLMKVTTLAELAAALADVDRDEPYPAGAAQVRRGKRAGTQRVVLPAGFLDADCDSD